MNVLDLLQNQMSDNVLEMLTKQVGGQDKQQTAAAANGIMSTLMAGLAKNAASPEGRSALANALDRDHDGSVLDDIMGMVSGNAQPQNQRATNGAGILGHILGGKQDNASDMISRMSGLDRNSTMSLMVKMAPMVMAALGKQKKEQSLDEGGLASLLSSTLKSNSNKQAEMSIIEKFIDQDGDGSIMDDLMNMGGSLLGNFFKKK
jgi:hypothetical protein